MLQGGLAELGGSVRETGDVEGKGADGSLKERKKKLSHKHKFNIRESVDSLCRDGADAQYMQYLSKSRITSPQTH